jgi:hypothetical protein
MSGHTPGPWRIVRRRGARGVDVTLVLSDAPGACICVARVETQDASSQERITPLAGEHNANARLIAAAPDLYAALFDLLDNEDTCQRCRRVEGERCVGHAALAKARGER